MSAHTALTIAATLVAWTLVSVALGLIVARCLPASPEVNEQQSADVDFEFDGRVAAQVRAINDFHAGLNLTTRERNHV